MKREHDRLYVVICAALVLAAAIAYEQVQGNGFINYDDDVYITANPHVRQGLTLQSVVWAFTTPHTGNWHPLTWLSHTLDCTLFGLDPLWPHLENLLLHIVNVLLLFRILRRTTAAVWASAFVAAAFALHPLHVESVAWAAERKDLLCGLFWMLTIAAYIRYARSPRTGNYLLVIIFFVLGLMSKPMIVTLPFVLLLLDWWPLGRLWGHQIDRREQPVWLLVKEKVPLFILTMVSSVITFIVQQKAGAMNVGKSFSLSVRISNALVCYIRYIAKIFYPSRLAVLYPHPGNNLSMWQAASSLLILLIISAAVIYAGRRSRFLMVGWFWYLGTLVPVIGLVQVGAQAMADRYTYLPSIGIFIMAAWGANELAAQWRHRRLVLGICAGLVLTVLMVCTRLQVRYWRNNFTLFGHALAATENNFVMHDSFGGVLFEEGRLDEAIEQFRQALRINPEYLTAYVNIGVVLLRQGKIDQAVEVLAKSAGSGGNYPKAHNYLGLCYARKGEFDLAVRNYNEAICLEPDYVEAIANLGIALKEQGKIDEAIKQWQKALMLEPDEPNIIYNLGLAMAELGDYDQAVRYFKAALAAKPDWAEAHYNLACLYYQQGSFDTAIEHCNESVRLKPDYPDAHYILGQAFVRLGKYDGAIKHLAALLELDPNNVDVLEDTAWLLATVSVPPAPNANKAVAYARRACELTEYKDVRALDTLAAAFAAASRFDDAVSTAERAVDAANAAGEEELAAEISERLKLYKLGQPYRQK
jgi:tetratricopeptide (TPR) repeat protein